MCLLMLFCAGAGMAQDKKADKAAEKAAKKAEKEPWRDFKEWVTATVI